MYLDEQLITYLGNKRKLLEIINQAAEPKGKVCLDLFSGSGVVARSFKENECKKIIVNDLEYYSKVINQCYLTNFSDFPADYDLYSQEIKNQKLIKGFISELYAPENSDCIKENERCFFTTENAMIIDTYLKAIFSIVPEEKRCFYIAPLLSQASIHSNTSGVFKGFYKNKQGVGQWGGEGRNALSRICGKIELLKPVLSSKESEVEIFQEDACKTNYVFKCDVAYLDPPYNQHPYGSNYFMLNAIAKNKRPEKISKVSGIPLDWNRSLFNKQKQALKALQATLSKIEASRIIISYNNEGFIQYNDMLELLKNYGDVYVLSEEYPTFRGCRNLSNRDIHTTEYLFCIM